MGSATHDPGAFLPTVLQAIGAAVLAIVAVITFAVMSAVTFVVELVRALRPGPHGHRHVDALERVPAHLAPAPTRRPIRWHGPGSTITAR